LIGNVGPVVVGTVVGVVVERFFAHGGRTAVLGVVLGVTIGVSFGAGIVVAVGLTCLFFAQGGSTTVVGVVSFGGTGAAIYFIEAFLTTSLLLTSSENGVAPVAANFANTFGVMSVNPFCIALSSNLSAGVVPGLKPIKF